MESTVLRSLMTNSEYFDKVYSKLDSSLFSDPNNDTIFSTIKTYVNDYNKKPNLKEIGLTIKESNKINKNLKITSLEKFKELAKDLPIDNIDYMLNQTLLWIQRQRLTHAVFTSADIIQEDGEFEPIVSMFEDALNISFDTSVGLDYSTSVDDRLDYYHSKEVYTSTGLKNLDEALGGGIRPSSLFMFLGPTHSGKTAAKVFTAANFLLQKENVLFITLEMPEMEIAKRIDANLLGTTINDLSELPIQDVKDKFDKIKDKIGKLVIKEYGAGTFNTLHLKSLLNDLSTKQGFKPDAIFIDYLGLMVSPRAGTQANSYEMLGKVAEDLHALAKETHDSKDNKGIKVISSSQANRSSMGNVDSGMEAVSESLKIAMTADVMVMLTTTEQMRDLNQQLWKLVKNRYTGQMVSLMMETCFERMMYSPYQGEYEDYNQEEVNTSSITQPKKDEFDFGSITF